MAHREGIREYLKDVKVYGLVFDWGCGTKPIKNYLKANDAEFITIDKRPDVGADIVADIESVAVDAKNERLADFAFCLEVLEHCWKTKEALFNIWANLKERGVLYISVPFLYEVHKEDDRIRFTHHGLRQLLGEADFKVEDIQATVGDLDHAEGYIVKATK